mmetsp:Transcript_65747/g.181902  ORF Transcript_65747/g.181902 Transcript_65747/m.181902 type:complete len:201 (-) Transcript_65747:41-643(-)
MRPSCLHPLFSVEGISFTTLRCRLVIAYPSLSRDISPSLLSSSPVNPESIKGTFFCWTGLGDRLLRPCSRCDATGVASVVLTLALAASISAPSGLGWSPSGRFDACIACFTMTLSSRDVGVKIASFVNRSDRSLSGDVALVGDNMAAIGSAPNDGRRSRASLASALADTSTTWATWEVGDEDRAGAESGAAPRPFPARNA